MSAVTIKAGGICSASAESRRSRASKESSKHGVPLLLPQDKFAKCVSIKRDPPAPQLSLQDCIISAAGVDPVCQRLSVLPADGGRGVKARLHRQIIAPRKLQSAGRGSELPQTDAACAVRGRARGRRRLGDDGSLPPPLRGADISLDWGQVEQVEQVLQAESAFHGERMCQRSKDAGKANASPPQIARPWDAEYDNEKPCRPQTIEITDL